MISLRLRVAFEVRAERFGRGAVGDEDGLKLGGAVRRDDGWGFGVLHDGLL
ncbi:MAG: hypothetical protein KGO02_12040 [Alphaproteobacteria bacterium]|nr:hypothetical protein [Alphaproteobacteria bacterium]